MNLYVSMVEYRASQIQPEEVAGEARSTTTRKRAAPKTPTA
jgi:hypothetical protein